MALLVCAALWGAPSSAFFQDLLLPLHEAKQALLHPPQPYPQPQPVPQYPPQYPPQYSYQQQHRRSMYDAPVQQGYAYTRPAVYQQWVQPATQPRPLSYDVGTAYSYGGSNPFSTFWQQQSSWLPQGLPWLSNRQQLQVQPQVQQVQPLSAVAAAQQPQLVAQPALPAAQPQPPLQGIWGFLPWSGNYQAASGTGGNNPVISFFQNQASLLPWNQQGHQVAARPVVYTTPLAPSPAAGHAGHGQGATSLQLTADLPVATLSASSASPSLPSDGQDVKPDGLVLDDIVTVQSLADNGIRRIHQDGTPCA